VESGYSAFFGYGLFLIYFGTENNNFQKRTDVIMEELKKMRNKSLGIIQLSKAKSQIKGAIARGYENHENLMLSIGKSLLVLNRIDTLGESCRKIDNLNSSDLLEIANEIFSLPELSFLTYK
jgi:predicted Zn-dependent peptidase